MAENLDLTKGIQIIPQSSTPTGDLPVPELTPAMEPATITTPSPPISSSGGSSTGVITEFLGFSIEFWLIAFLILGLATLVYMYWDQI